MDHILKALLFTDIKTHCPYESVSFGGTVGFIISMEIALMTESPYNLKTGFFHSKSSHDASSVSGSVLGSEVTKTQRPCMWER